MSVAPTAAHFVWLLHLVGGRCVCGLVKPVPRLRLAQESLETVACHQKPVDQESELFAIENIALAPVFMAVAGVLVQKNHQIKRSVRQSPV